MYCATCHYDLKGLSQDRCPECGRAFDPNDPATYISDATWFSTGQLLTLGLCGIMIGFLLVFAMGVALQIIGKMLRL